MQHTTNKELIISFNGNLDDFIQKRQELGDKEEVALMIGLKDSQILTRFEKGISTIKPATYSLFCLLSDSHPHYKLQKQSKGVSPLLINAPNNSIKRKKIRTNAKHTQEQMANLLKLNGKSIISRYEKLEKNPNVQNWTMYLLGTDQHPFFKLIPLP